jgi:hypothetical protein
VRITRTRLSHGYGRGTTQLAEINGMGGGPGRAAALLFPRIDATVVGADTKLCPALMPEVRFTGRRLVPNRVLAGEPIAVLE